MKKFFQIAMAMMLVISIVACGGSSSESQEDEVVTLKLLTGMDYLPKFQPYIDQYMADNPNVIIEGEQSTGAELDNKLNMAHASDSDYDLMWINGASIKQFVATGVVAPLSDYIANSNVDMDDFNPQLAKDGTVDGTIYGLSVAPGTRILAYNKKILDKHGFDVPTTQAEILEISRIVFEEEDMYGYVRPFHDAAATLYNDGGFWMSNGARIVEDNGDGTYTSVVDSPEMIDSVKWWKEMTAFMPQDVNFAYSNMREYFGQGRVMFYVFAPWEYNLIPGMEYGVDYDLLMIPGPEPVATLGGWYLGIGGGSKHKDIAWDFIEGYMTDPAMVAQCSLTLPGTLSAFEYAPFNEDKYIPFLDSMQNCELPLPIITSSQRVTTMFFDAWNEILLGGADPVVRLGELDADIQDVLDDE